MTFVIEEILNILIQNAQLALGIEKIHQASFVDCDNPSFCCTCIILQSKEWCKELIQYIIICSIFLILRAIIITLELQTIQLKSRTISIGKCLAILTSILNMPNERSLAIASITSNNDKLVLQSFYICTEPSFSTSSMNVKLT